MRALLLSVVMLMSAVASAQTQAQGLARPPPSGTPTGPSRPTTPVPGYTKTPPGDSSLSYEEWEGPEGFRRRGSLAVVEREELIDRLARMEDLLGRAMDRTEDRGGRDARELRNALRKIREEMNGLRDDITQAPDLRYFRRRQAPPPPPQPVPEPVVQPISEPQLQRLVSAIAKEPFGDGKLRVLESAAPSQYFLVAQVQRIIGKFSFGDDKLKAVRVLWPRVVDRENGYQLYQSFTFQGEKDQLREIIGR